MVAIVVRQRSELLDIQLVAVGLSVTRNEVNFSCSWKSQWLSLLTLQFLFFFSSLVQRVRNAYPDAYILLTGHSLGIDFTNYVAFRCYVLNFLKFAGGSLAQLVAAMQNQLTIVISLAPVGTKVVFLLLLLFCNIYILLPSQNKGTIVAMAIQNSKRKKKKEGGEPQIIRFAQLVEEYGLDCRICCHNFRTLPWHPNIYMLSWTHKIRSLCPRDRNRLVVCAFGNPPLTEIAQCVILCK